MKYEVKYGEKVELWQDVSVVVDASSKEEAIKKAIEGQVEKVVSIDRVSGCEKVTEKKYNTECGDYTTKL